MSYFVLEKSRVLGRKGRGRGVSAGGWCVCVEWGWPQPLPPSPPCPEKPEELGWALDICLTHILCVCFPNLLLLILSPGAWDSGNGFLLVQSCGI